MSYQNYIEGVFRLTSPLHTAQADENKSGNETPTAKQLIFTRRGAAQLPYFPGSDLRGRLRRKAAKLLLDALCVNGKASRELYSGICSGSISASPDKNPPTVEELLRARENPYMVLTGGGARMLRTHYDIADLVPIIADTIEANLVPARYGEMSDTGWLPRNFDGEGLVDSQGYKLLAKRQQIRVDDAFRVLRPEEMERYIDDVVVEVARYQEDVLYGRKERADDKAARSSDPKKAKEKGAEAVKKSDIGNIYTIECIAPGVPMYFKLDPHDDLPDAALGLLLQSLVDLINEQGLGGFVRNGFGRFTADLDFVRNGVRKPLLYKDDTGYRLADSFAGLIEPMREGLAKLTFEEVMTYFNPQPVNSKKESKAA